MVKVLPCGAKAWDRGDLNPDCKLPKLVCWPSYTTVPLVRPLQKVKGFKLLYFCLLLKDRFGREVDNLRLAVTGRCNLACFFCHHEGYTPNICSASKTIKELSKEDIGRIVSVAAGHGISRVKLTGGEPLLRPDIGEIIQTVKGIKGINEVSMVTNGVFLEENLKNLGGLNRMNVSIHTSRPAVYKKITGRGLHSKVLDGIRQSIAAGLPVKLNMTIIKGLNENEVPEMTALAKELGADLQVIEYHSQNFKETLAPNIPHIEAWLEANSEKSTELYDNRRRKFLVNGVWVTLVNPMFNKDFCNNCHRLRVTPDGSFKPCLLRQDNHVKFDPASEACIDDAFVEAVRRREPFFK